MIQHIKTEHLDLANTLLQVCHNKSRTDQLLKEVFLAQPSDDLWVATNIKFLDQVNTTRLIRLNRNKQKIKQMQFVRWLRNQTQCICKRQTPFSSNPTCSWICLQKENKLTIIRTMCNMMIEPTPLLRIPKSSRKHQIQSWRRSRQREVLISKLGLAQNHLGINLKTQ